MCVCDIAAALGLTISAASHQMLVLRTRGRVRLQHVGRIVHYTLNDDHVRSIGRRCNTRRTPRREREWNDDRIRGASGTHRRPRRLHLLRGAGRGSTARRIIAANIAISIGTKLVFRGLAVTGQATLWMAIVADMGVSLLVIANGLRLLRWRRQATGNTQQAIRKMPTATVLPSPAGLTTTRSHGKQG